MNKEEILKQLDKLESEEAISICRDYIRANKNYTLKTFKEMKLDVDEYASEKYGINIDEFYENLNCNKRCYSDARRLVILVAVLKNKSREDIAKLYNKKQSTITNALHAVLDLYSFDKETKNKVDDMVKEFMLVDKFKEKLEDYNAEKVI